MAQKRQGVGAELFGQGKRTMVVVGPRELRLRRLRAERPLLLVASSHVEDEVPPAQSSRTLLLSCGEDALKHGKSKEGALDERV